MLDCFIKINNYRSFVNHFISFVCAFIFIHIFATYLVCFPSRKRWICCVYVDTGVCRCNPYLVVFVQPDCNGRSTLLVGFLAVQCVKIAAVYHQVVISDIATVDRKTPREDVQTRGRGRKSVITPVKSVADVCLYCVETDDWSRTVGCCAWRYCSKGNIKTSRT